MTLGSWTCKASPPSRYRHIFLKLPNRRSFYLLTISNKTNTPLAEVGQTKQPLPQARRWLLEICGARPVSTCKVHEFHVKSMILYWFTWLLVYCFLFVSFGHTQWLQPLHRTKKKQATRLVCVCVLFLFPLFLLISLDFVSILFSLIMFLYFLCDPTCFFFKCHCVVWKHITLYGPTCFFFKLSMWSVNECYTLFR